LPRRKVDLLILGSTEMVTMNGQPSEDDLGVVEGGGVAVDAGNIVMAASSELLERRFVGRRSVNVDEKVLLPGFIDPHTHLVFEGSREQEFQQRIQGVPYMEILKGHGGILETVNKTREATHDELFSTAVSRLDTALEAGTTTIEVKSGYGLRPYDEMKILQVIRTLRRQHLCRVVPTFMGAHAVPPETDAESYTRLIIEEMLPEVRRTGLAQFCDVFCEQGVFDEKQSMSILKAAKQAGLATKIHADEFTDSNGARVANKLSSTSGDHLVHTPARELERMAATGVTPVVLPSSSQSLLAKEYAPARELLELGLPVALGTDFSPANWTLSQVAVAWAAARELRMKADEILRGITINAAMALGMENQVGSLAPKKIADLVTLKVPNHKWVSYAHSDGLIDKVFIGGRLVVDDGKKLV